MRNTSNWNIHIHSGNDILKLLIIFLNCHLKDQPYSFFRVFRFHSCRYPSENPTASWLVLGMYCSAVTPTPPPLGPFSWRQRCLPCLVLTSLSLGISPGDLVTTCRSGKKRKHKNRDIPCVIIIKCILMVHVLGFFFTIWWQRTNKSETTWQPSRWFFRFLTDDLYCQL